MTQWLNISSFFNYYVFIIKDKRIFNILTKILDITDNYNLFLLIDRFFFFHSFTLPGLFFYNPTCKETSLVAQMVKNLSQCRRPGFSPWVRKIPWRMEWQPTSVLLPWKFLDSRAWQATVHGVPKSWTWLSNYRMQREDYL